MEAALPSTAMSVEYKDQKGYMDRASTNAKMLDWIRTQLAPPGSALTKTSLSEDNSKPGINGSK
jgi:hypothetical protein